MKDVSESPVSNVGKLEKPKLGFHFRFRGTEMRLIPLIGLFVMHGLALAALIRVGDIKPATWILQFIVGIITGLGVTAGAHRLWAHKAYKAKLPLQIFLLLCHTITFQKSVLHWCRDHRVHHKFTETDADPHNAKRGFFFAHMGWLMLKKHPDVTKKGKTLDLSDLETDPLIRFQHKYYAPLLLIISLVQIYIPVIFWRERFLLSFLTMVTRVLYMYHGTWLVNSAAHLYGNRPYDKTINPRENWWVAFITIGEGFHNYHHVFPWDYSTSEFGIKLNLTTMFINTMAFLGQAYDLRKVDDAEVRKRAMRTGEHHSDHSEISRGEN